MSIMYVEVIYVKMRYDVKVIESEKNSFLQIVWDN